MISTPHQSAFSGTSGVTAKGVRWARALPKDSPFLYAYRGLPEREFEAIRLWTSGFYSFQRPWVFEPQRFALANKARQIGWSHGTAGAVTLWGIAGEETTIVSNNERSAKLTLAKVKDHAQTLRDLGSELAAVISSSDERVVFASGGVVQSFSSKGARSFTGNLVLDEFAYHMNPTEVWDASAPVLTTGKLKLRVISTPNGQNEFKERVDNARAPRSRWAYYEVPMSVAIAAGYPVIEDDIWVLANNDARLYAQLYECSFLDNILQYIPGDKIAAATTSTVAHRDGPGKCYAGLDIGHTSDRTVLTVIRVYQGVSQVVHVESMARTDSDGMEAMVAWAFREYRLTRLCIDESGMGTYPAERMQKIHGDVAPVDYRRNKVELINFQLKSKEELATELYSAIVGGRILLPASEAQLPMFNRRNVDRDGREYGPAIVVNAPPTPGDDANLGAARTLLVEIAAIQRRVTEHGKITYVSPKTKTGHGDAAWSLALAIHATDEVHPAVLALQQRMARGA